MKFVSDPPTKALPETLLKNDRLPNDLPILRLQKTINNSDGTSSQFIKQAKSQEPNLIDKIANTLLTPKRRLTIVSPYFVPSAKWTQRFVDLAKKGIELNILTNSLTASLHAKTFSVDGEMLFVGSFNFDPRSAAINTEMGAIIHSPILAGQLDDMIEK